MDAVGRKTWAGEPTALEQPTRCAAFAWLSAARTGGRGVAAAAWQHARGGGGASAPGINKQAGRLVWATNCRRHGEGRRAGII